MKPDEIMQFIAKSGYQEELVKACVLLDVVLESLVWGIVDGGKVSGVAVIESEKECSYELPVLSQYLTRPEARIMYTHWLSGILRENLDHFGAPHVRGLKSKFTFGTHKGETVAEVIKSDPGYIEWCLDGVEGFEMDVDASTALENFLGLEDDLEGVF